MELDRGEAVTIDTRANASISSASMKRDISQPLPTSL